MAKLLQVKISVLKNFLSADAAHSAKWINIDTNLNTVTSTCTCQCVAPASKVDQESAWQEESACEEGAILSPSSDDETDATDVVMADKERVKTHSMAKSS